MPHIRHIDPGYLVVWYPPDAAPGQECLTMAFTGETAARDARVKARQLLDLPGAPPVRVFVMLEVYHVTGATQRRLPDDWQPVVDMMLREQLAGKGMTTAARGPPRVPPEQTIREAAEAARKEREDDQG